MSKRAFIIKLANRFIATLVILLIAIIVINLI